MRAAWILIVLIAIAIGAGLLRDSAQQPMFEQVALPFRLARLYAQPAEKSIRMPVQGVSPDQVANTWKAPRRGGRRHEGQDIFARRGTPVLAATDGIVVRVGGGELGGNALLVAGRGARTFYYAHLDSYAPDIDAGDAVRQGQVLGYVGNTGNARTTPPHLHFGVYTATGAVNPLVLLRGREAESGRG